MPIVLETHRSSRGGGAHPLHPPLDPPLKANRNPKLQGHVAALVRSHMNGLLQFETKIKQTTETMLRSPKTIRATTVIKQ